MKKIKRRLAAIMFTDMVGYSALMQKDEMLAGRLRDRHREVFVRNTTQHGGEILQYYGDGTLSIYPSASAAVECALDIQRELKQEPAVSLRIGIHTGDVSYGDEDVFGDGVNIASRIEKLCVPGGIFISGKVQDDIKNRPSIHTRSIGPFKLRNIFKEIEIFAVTNQGVTAPPPGYHYKISPLSRRPTAPPPPVRRRKKKIAAALFAFFFGVFGTHRFYLGQRRLGIMYLGAAVTSMFIIKWLSFLIPILGIISFIDAMILLVMPRSDFDRKYNSVQVEETIVEETQTYEPPKREIRRQPAAPPQKSSTEVQFDKLWKKALAEYQEYDYNEAIALLKKAVELKPTDAEAHFMLACCFSINEKINNALHHLEVAVTHGLVDQGRIQTHRDLAYLRMQPQFDSFANNGYRLLRELPEPGDDLLQSKGLTSSNLLEQLQELKKLREEGQLTEVEYQIMMRKLNS